MDQQTPNNPVPNQNEPYQNASPAPLPQRPQQPAQDISMRRPTQQVGSIGGIQPSSRPIYRPVNRPLSQPRPMQRPAQNTVLQPQTQSAQPLQPLTNQSNPYVQPSVPPQQSTQGFPSPQQPLRSIAQPSFQQQQPSAITSQPIPQPTQQQPPQPQPVAPNIDKSPEHLTLAEKKQAKKKNILRNFIRKNKKNILKVSVILILIFGGIQLLSFYSIHYNSVYKKLAVTTYNHKGVSFSFNYPSVMQNNKTIEGQLDHTPLAYTYNISDQEILLVDATYIPTHKAIQTLKLSNDEVLNQLKANSGSYIDYLYKTYPGSYNDIFKNCHDFKTGSPGSYLLCTFNGTQGTVAHVVGLDDNYQYGMNIFIPKSVYSIHQDIWKKIENSFSIQ